MKYGYGIGKEGWDDKEGWDWNLQDEAVQPMRIVDCPKCGLVPTATGTCGYCGSKCE